MDDSNETRTCTVCSIPKPATYENFETRTYPNGKTVFRAQCRVCRRLPLDKRAPDCSIQPDRGAVTPSKFCNACGSMPWRVPGIRCKCGLRYAAEPKPELVTHRDYERTI